MSGSDSAASPAPPPGEPRLEKAGEIFFFIRELPQAQRPAAVERACAGDPELKSLVTLLLRGDEAPLAAEAIADDIRAAGDVSAQPARSRETAETLGLTAADYAGSRIGRYKLLERIGEGGFGIVFAAAQTEPVKRLVALKIIKLGMDTRQVVARFEAERQALALMDHPNIARVFDAGATATGRPYFVMELVRGLPITEYCDKHRLTIRERLDLVVQVCDAVQHAHQKGVIHRDIKPSNVLVSALDADRVVPKIIDFGVAKATSARLTEKTVYTELRQMIGTPEYMSPEQAGEYDHDVDTRTDVYSLGVLMYELLAGTTPFDSNRLRSAAFGEMQRIIREEDPPKPSTTLRSKAEALEAIAAARSIPSAKLQRSVHGELDWIVMKAMEKDRMRRYDTAGSMARDVQRYLAGEAVQAAPPSAAYMARKFIRRNRGLVLAASLLAMSLIAGLIGTSVGLFNTEAQRKIAVKEQTRADKNASQALTAEAAATRAAYSANLMSASSAMNGVQYSTARAFLDAAPERLRGWEWCVLHARLDSSIRTCTTTAIPRTSDMCELLLHPDGRSFVTIDRVGDPVAQRWDLESGRLIQSVPPPVGPSEAPFFWGSLSPDGGCLTVTPYFRTAGFTSFTVEAWGLSTGERMMRVEVPCPTDSEVHTIASRDGTRVYAHAFDRVWSVHLAPDGAKRAAAGERTSALLSEQPLTQPAYVLAINHADSLIAEANWSPPFDLVLRDARSLMPVTVLETGNFIENASFSADDRWLGVAIADDTARVWDLAAKPPTSVALNHPYQATNIRFSPDASLVATIAIDQAIRIWDRASGKLLSTYPSQTLDPYPLMFMPDGKTVAGWESDGTIRFWDVTAEGAAVLRGHKSIVSAAKFAAGNPAGIIVSSSWEGADGSTGIVRFWDAESGDEVGTYHGQLGDIVYKMEVSDDGRFAALGIVNQIASLRVRSGVSDEPFVRTDIIDLTTVERIVTSPSRRDPRWITFSSDNRSVIWASSQVDSAQFWQLHLLDARTGAVMRSRELDSRPFWLLARSPDARTIAALPTTHKHLGAPADLPGTMHFLDTQTLETVREIRGFPERQSSMAFSPDGARIVMGGEDGIVRLFDGNTGQLLAASSSRGMEILTLAFNPDGTRLASAGLDRMVRIWDARTLDQLAAFGGHQGHIGCVDWDADGHRLVSCSGDFTVRVWEPDPIRTRIQARARRAETIAQVESLVAGLFAEGREPAGVVERLTSDASLTELQRRVALQLVLQRGLARTESK